MGSYVTKWAAIGSMLILVGCGGGGGGNAGSSSSPPPTPSTFTVSVTVSGLAAGASVTIKNNNSDSLTFSSNTTQSFATQLAANAGYNVTVSSPPDLENCVGASGVVTGATNVPVTCTLAPPSTVYPASTAPYPQVAAVLPPAQVIASPIIIPVFFSDSPFQATTVSFLQNLVTSKEWGVLAEYGVGAATVGTPVYLSSAAPISTTSVAIQAFVAANASSWATLDGREIFVLHYPSTTTVTDTNVAGLHFSALTSGNQRVTAAFVLETSAIAVDVDYHEIAEAATSPSAGVGYVVVDRDRLAWDLLLGATELGDMCDSWGLFADASLGYSLQAIWSNAAVIAGQAPCISPEATTPAFGAYPVLPDTFVSNGLSNASVTIAPGTSITIPISFFSYAALTAPISISVVQTNLKSDQSNALHFSLDRSTGLNGSVAHLTITAPTAPFAAPQNYAGFSVISTSPPSGTQVAQSVFPGLVSN